MPVSPGRKNSPTPDLAHRIAHAFGVGLAEVFTFHVD